MEASRVLLVVSIFCLALCHAKHGRDLTVCTPEAPGVGDPGRDVKLPDQFYVHMELISVKERLTTTLTEYFDKEKNRGMIFQHRKGEQLKAYYDYRTNEFLQVYPLQKNKCVISQLSTDENNVLMGTTLKNGTVRMFSAAKALRFANRGIYQGLETVRGIICDHWKSCQYDPGMDQTVVAHWYFTAKDPWTTATGAANVPVRYHIKGTIYENNIEKRDVEEYHEFYHFRSGLPKDPTIFETPSGVYCEGRKSIKRLPKLPEVMSFYTEIVDKNDVIVTTMKEEYSRSANLARFAYTALPEFNLYGKYPVVDIHDFLTGVSYVTNTVLGNCTARPIPSNGLDVKDVNAHDVRMASAASFFEFPNKNFAYEGSKTIRGIDAESWVGVRDGWPRKTSKQSTWEWYFAKDSTIAITAGGEVAYSTPLQFRVTLPEEQINYDFNIYSYSKEQPDLTSYDVSQCFLFHKREKIGMSIPIMYESFVQSNVKQFKLFFLAAIATTTGISTLRIQNFDLEFGDEFIFIRFEIVDVAPIVGDVLKPMKEVPLDKAVKILSDKLDTNTFVVEVFNGQQATLFRPQVVSADVIKYKNAPRKASFTPKSMAALGVVMTLVGATAGGLFAFCRGNK